MPNETYLVSKENSRRYRLNGIQRPDYRQEQSSSTIRFGSSPLVGAAELPPKVDLRQQMTTVEDQSQLASCVANTLAGIYEYLVKKATGRSIDVSRLFIYYNARVKAANSSSITDSGCVMTDAVETLKQFGTCLESTCPYELANVDTRPSDEAFEQAKQYRITEAVPVEINLNEMKSCLAQGYPIAFGLELFGSFDNASKTGVVPMPNPNDGTRESHGNHAMLAVGYSDQSRAFIVRNSWGEDWGDKGYCYIPYDYLTNIDHCFDTWTIRKLMNDDFGQENWSYEDNYNYLQENDNIYGPTNSVIETYDITGKDSWTNSDTGYQGYQNVYEENFSGVGVEYVDDTSQYTTNIATTDYTYDDNQYSYNQTN